MSKRHIDIYDIYPIINELQKENTKLKEALKFLCEELDIKLCSSSYSLFKDQEYYLEYRSNTNLKTLHKITKEKYNLLGEVLVNE